MPGKCQSADDNSKIVFRDTLGRRRGEIPDAKDVAVSRVKHGKPAPIRAEGHAGRLPVFRLLTHLQPDGPESRPGFGNGTKKVLVIASGDKIREAQEAGADFVGGEEMVTKIQTENWTDYDAVIATPDMMRSVGKLGKVLGPRGLMPNPKTGTVTTNVAQANVQIRSVAPEFHRRLKARAAMEGMSMSEYILREVGKALERPMRQDVLDRLRSRPARRLARTAADVIRAERDAR